MVVIADFTRVTISHLRLFSINDVINFVDIIRTSSIGRHKKMIMVALPSFAAMLLEAAKKVMGEKLRSRIKLVKSMADIKDEIDMTLLPSEYGGKVTETVMMTEFRKLALERSSKLQEIVDGVDWDKVALETDEESCTIA